MVSFSVVAQPPFQQTTITGNVLEIDFPKIEFFPLGKDLQFNYHVFNQTGMLLLNDSTSCIFHLMSFTGTHLIETPLLFDTPGNDFFINITSENVSVVGSYAWLVRCNNSDGKGGFVSGSFEVSVDGLNPEKFPFWLPIILAIAFSAALFLSTSFMIRVKELTGVKILLFLMGIINTMFLLSMPYFISLNPGRIDTFKVVGESLLVISILLLLYIIYLYSVFLVRRMIKQRKDERDY